MTDDEVNVVTLRALEGEPLADADLRSMIVATAHALAERHGVKVVEIETGHDHLTAHLCLSRLGAIGFAAELRRLTTAWYTKKYGERTLWGEPTRPDDDDDSIVEDWFLR